MTPCEHIRVTDESGVRLVTMDRPKKKNAITQDMYAAMAGAIREAQNAPHVRVVMLTGAGGVFTAGNDMGAFLNPQARMGNTDLPVERFMHAILEANKPLIGVVGGLAIGIGVTMLLHCDLVYAGRSASFSTPFVNLGLMPEAGSSLLLPFAVGPRMAAQMLMFGESMDAQEAVQAGLVNAVYADNALMDKALERARTLAAKPPGALLTIKALLNRAPEAPARRMARESALFGERLQSAECHEAATAFFEKRDPDFSNLP